MQEVAVVVHCAVAAYLERRDRAVCSFACNKNVAIRFTKDATLAQPKRQ